MSHTIVIGSNKRFVVKVASGQFLLRKHDGDIIFSDTEATAFMTHEGAMNFSVLSEMCDDTVTTIVEATFDVKLEQPYKKPAHMPDDRLKRLESGRATLAQVFVPSAKAPSTIETRLRALIEEEMGLYHLAALGKKGFPFYPTSKFVEDLGADSFDLIELVMAVEDEFEVQIGDEEAEACKCMQDVLDLLLKLNAR